MDLFQKLVSRLQVHLYIRVTGKRCEGIIAHVFRQWMRGQPPELLGSAHAVQHAAVAGWTFSREESCKPVVVFSLRIAVRKGGSVDGAGYAHYRLDPKGQFRISDQKMQDIGRALGI